MIGRVAAAVGIAVMAAAAPAGGGALQRHRLILPTPPLPHNLTVDESEWQIIPSERIVAAGTVTMEVYDRGQDEHNLTVQGPITSSGDGTIRGQVWLQSGASTTLTEKLAPGRYKLYCSMFAGTPQSHEAMGMLSSITVR
jgi:plastocyanin